MIVYRIVHNNYSANLFASGLKGRWNSAGKKVIYTAESIPLAFLENMIKRQGVGFNRDFKILVIEIPENLPMKIVNISALKKGWRDFMDYSKCQPIGDKWYEEGRTLILKVPSAIITEAFNYVINSESPDFDKVKLIAKTDLVPDKRIEEILKNQPRK